nr:hypothetical protein [uncultured Roseateles sp.]
MSVMVLALVDLLSRHIRSAVAEAIFPWRLDDWRSLAIMASRTIRRTGSEYPFASALRI